MSQNSLDCRGRVVSLQGPLIMGILNVTPDSFSDGALFQEPKQAIDKALALIKEGADILDIGGESTRPGAENVPVELEIERVVPILEALRAEDVLLSIDTRKAAVASRALQAGAHIVNDVSGGEDPDMFSVVAKAQAAYVLMHSRGTPDTMMDLCNYRDVVLEVKEFLQERAELAKAAGIKTVIVDPGIGFAKNAEQNHQLLRATRELVDLGYPVLIGPSRKSFIGKLTGQPAAERVEGSIAAAVLSVSRGAHIVRVHDVLAIKRALLVTEAILGL